jgi:mannose-6-phosphate isomerase-like protein (cupin superfamily)
MIHRALGTHHIVPAPNGMVIDEHYGRASDGAADQSDYSVARLFAPAGWNEPPQVCQFEEVSLVVSGQLLVETPVGTAIVGPGESCVVPAGTRVQYRNASAQIPCEYWSLCVPAWRPERVEQVG